MAFLSPGANAVWAPKIHVVLLMRLTPKCRRNTALLTQIQPRRSPSVRTVRFTSPYLPHFQTFYLPTSLSFLQEGRADRALPVNFLHSKHFLIPLFPYNRRRACHSLHMPPTSVFSSLSLSLPHTLILVCI